MISGTNFRVVIADHLLPSTRISFSLYLCHYLWYFTGMTHGFWLIFFTFRKMSLWVWNMVLASFCLWINEWLSSIIIFRLSQSRSWLQRVLTVFLFFIMFFVSYNVVISGRCYQRWLSLPPDSKKFIYTHLCTGV